MKKLNLNGIWTMTDDQGTCTQGSVPGSVYSFLLDAGKMEDPYWRDNELSALALMEKDYSFSRMFDVSPDFLNLVHQVLRFDGIDTLADICLNGKLLGSADNMHSWWEYDVRGILKENGNELQVQIHSPTRYIAEKDKEHHLGGSYEAMKGFPHLRKAHCMFGWDWGPRLPDQGIWKDVQLLGWENSRITDVKIRQEHFLAGETPALGAEGHSQASGGGTPALGAEGHSRAARAGEVLVDLTVDVIQSGDLPVEITLCDPDGKEYRLENKKPFRVPDPKLWWPNGLGEQPLYTVTARLIDEKKEDKEPEGEELEGKKVEDKEREADLQVRRIGLRTVRMKRTPDTWGETFAAEVNGQTFFSMGADYIPEDCILSRMNEERTRQLLEDCIAAHFNVIRVWGGGFYPFDFFYDLCDEMGLLVWQDCMFACANFRITPEFVDSITTEIRQNVQRLRHHPSLGLWCGNNEMEQFAAVKVYEGDDITAADYLIQNEYIIPEIIRAEDPDAYYWPSSPSSGGKFVVPSDPDRGDVHYWAVWHEGVPFTEYRKYNFRYLSEFGFQSFPCPETVKSFTEEEDRNVFSYVMEMHQRNTGANGKILQYLSATYQYPTDFETLLYASQLLQAEAIRYGVEHFRRNRNEERCMGAVYWQLNDNWPVASWASIDYFGRWKALHYYAVRFFSPVMLSCEEDSIVSQGKTCVSEPEPGISTARLCVTNETWDAVQDKVCWTLRDETSRILEEGETEVTVEPFTSLWLDTMDFSQYDYRSVHLSYSLEKHGSSGSVLFAPPKHYKFTDPGLTLSVDPETKEVTVTASAYAKAVEIYSPEGYVRLSDNYFDMEKGSRTISILDGAEKPLFVRSVYDIH